MIRKILQLTLVLIFLLCSFNTLLSQDLTAFEIIDNASVGLTVAPFEKWGQSVHDIDRNGYPDIFCVRWSSPGYSRIFINDGGNFQDITNQTPIEAIETEETNTRTTLWVDYDNDGDRDLAMTTNESIHLLRNDNNVFTEISEEVGFVGYIPPGFIPEWGYNQGGWADYDLDGDLDCAITQEYNDNIYLFRNDEGQFTNVATEAGLDSCLLATSTRLGWIDIDFDGDPDLFDRFHIMRNDDGYFTDITETMGWGELPDINMRDFFDYDNDGDWDYIQIVYRNRPPAVNGFWENQDGLFVDITGEVGIPYTHEQERYRGLTIGDCDNDGDEDIFLQNNIPETPDALYVNDEVAPGERAFADVGYFVGLTELGDNKGAVFFDYDRDGFLDIYVSSAEHNHVLYHNVANNGANWIGFILEGTLSNRDAIGSLVSVYTGDKRQIRYRRCESGYLEQDNPWIHFGIGFETGVDSVVIRWPLGYKQVFTDIDINQYHEIKEPDYSSVQSRELNSMKSSRFLLEQNYPNPFNSSTRIDFNLKSADYVSLVIHDMTGREILNLVSEKREPGFHSVTWDGRDANGVLAATGVYISKLQVKNQIQSRKIVLIK
jgi:hypothetical protein